MPARRPVIFLVALLASMCSAAVELDEAEVASALAREHVPGIAVAVVDDGQVDVFAVGSAHPDTDVPVSADTLFEAASLSKTVFAVMFLEAVGAGELSLDARLTSTQSVRRIVDREAFARLTPRVLLSHRSGLTNWAGDSNDRERIDELTFEFPPGKRFRYSGEGFELLREHAEAERDETFENWFRAKRSVYGMQSSRFAFDVVPENSAAARGSARLPDRGISPSPSANAAASLITTAADYGQFMAYLLGHPDLLAALLTPQGRVESADSGNIDWGLGWGILTRADDSRLGFHWGDNGQFKAFVAIDPETSVAVVYFANGMKGLRLVSDIVEPVVGDLGPVRDWLEYE